MSVWVFAEHKNNELSSMTLELLSVGKKLAQGLGVELAAVLIGDAVEPLAKELVCYGAQKVYLVENPSLKRLETFLYSRIFEDLVKKYGPEVILFGSTFAGEDIAPRLACMLNTGLSAHCMDLKIDTSKRQLLQFCPFFEYMATIVCDSHPQIATVQRGVFPLPSRDPSHQGEIVKIEPEIKPPEVRLIQVEPLEKEETGLEEAEIVIGVGRGVKDFQMVCELARVLGASLGATLPAVELGLLPESHLIGQTGKIIRPKLYIACGISGAGHHIVGIQDSEVIVAINKDKNAPIFRVADYGIVGDVQEVLPALISSFS